MINTFSSIEKGEYNRLFDYVNQKKLRIKNRGKMVSESFLFVFSERYIYHTFSLVRDKVSLSLYLFIFFYDQLTN